MKFYSTLFSAIFKHISLALQLKHDGTGLPKEVPGAFLLAIVYIMINLLNQHHADGIPVSTFVMIGFIAQCYVLFLRNNLIGLILLISIICNAFSLLLTYVMGIPAENLAIMIVSEYILVTAAVVNVITSETSHI
jgi:hypothetical protein